MKKWHAASELVGTPGMPKTTQGVNLKAKREQYIARYRKAQGGGKEYHITSLPEKTQDYLTGKALKKTPAPATRHDIVTTEPVAQDIATLKAWQREVFNARVALYHEFEKLKALHGTTKAVKKLILLAETQTLPDHLKECVIKANARKGKKGRTLSKSMILGWQRKVKAAGLTALAPVAVEKKNIPPWVPYFLKCYQRPQNPSLAQALEDMTDILPENISVPSYYQVRRFHLKRSKVERERGRKTGAEYKALKGSGRRDTSKFLPLDIGVCDGHSFKAKVAHPVHGRPFKPEVCAVIDVATRVITGWSAGLAESAVTVADAIRHGATTNEHKQYGGVFSILYTDGGSGNTAKVNTDEFTGIFTRIGSEHHTGIAGNPQARGIIEIINKTVWIRAAKELPTFVGKSMDKLTTRNMYLLMDRDFKQKGGCEHVPSWPQFLEFLRQTIDNYNRRPHSALPKITDQQTGKRRHMAPLEVWAWHIEQGWDYKKEQLTERELEILFLPRIERKVTDSRVTLFTNTYYHKDLAHYEGELLQVGYNIHDGEYVQVWDRADRLICYAGFDKNKHDFFPISQVEYAREQRAKRRAKIKLDQLEEIEAERRGLVETTRQNNIITLQPISPVTKEDREQLQLEIEKVQETSIPTDDKGKFKFWNELDARLSEGETLKERELLFYEAYRKSASFKAFQSVAETLGETSSGLHA